MSLYSWSNLLSLINQIYYEYLYMSVIDIIYYEFLYMSLIDLIYYLNVSFDSSIITNKLHKILLTTRGLKSYIIPRHKLG